MSIVVCGINYKTADIVVREQVFFAAERLSLYFQELLPISSEVVLLSTCNRSEIYCEAKDPQLIIDWFCALHPAVKSSMYFYQGEMAVEHLMKVACGIDSMVLGEAEILGQLKVAFAESCSANVVGNSFHRLFQQVFSVAKEIRSTTEIGACPVSIASAICALIKQKVHGADLNFILVGAGTMIDLLLRYLHPHLSADTWIVNRHIDKAEQLASSYGVKSASLEQLGTLIPQTTVIITATGSLKPLLTKSSLQNIVQDRINPLYIFDIAVPRDVEPKVAELPNISLYCIDDLKGMIQANQQVRQHAAEKSLLEIQHKARSFMNQYLSFNQVSSTIRAYRNQIESICEEELHKILQSIRYGNTLIDQDCAEQIMRNFSRAVTQKLLHAPSVNLRKMGYEGRLDLLYWAKKLLSISEPDSHVV